MGHHSVAEAKNKLSDLIDRAMAGEAVVITRHGRPVVEIRAIEAPVAPLTDADLEWLRANRVGSRIPTEDAGTAVSRMRDEDWR